MPARPSVKHPSSPSTSTSTSTKKASKKAPTKKAPTKKAASKKAATKKAASKKAPTKKAPTKKAPTKKAPSKNTTTAADVDRWFATTCPPAFRATLKHLRARIQALAPTATECISYALPSFRYADHGLVAYGFGKTHCSFYPMSSRALRELDARLADFSRSAGTVRFTPDHPLPDDVVDTLVRLRMAENEAAQQRRRR